MALQHDILGLVPVAVLHRALQIRAMVAVQVGKYPVLVLQTAILSLGRALLDGREGTGLGRGEAGGRGG